MLVPSEYRIVDGEYYIPDVPGYLDGYICPCYQKIVEKAERNAQE